MESKEIEILALNNIADQSRKQGRKDEALLLFTQAVNLISEYGASPIVEAAVFSNFGILLTSLEQHDKAVQLQKRALELDRMTGIPGSIGYSSHNLGMALVASGDPSTGVKYLQEAREIRQSINDYDELVATLEMLSTAYLDMNQIDEAKKYVEQGYELKYKVSHPSILRGVITILAQVVLKEGDIDRACMLQSEAIVLLEQLRQKNSSLARLDLFDSRYNKRYLDAIELFLEAKCYHAAFELIDRTRFRSGCDILEGVRTFGSPLEKGSIIIPKIEKNELILTEWIYPKYSWVFLLKSESHGIPPKKIITSSREGPPIKLDLSSQWYDHFKNMLRQTQCVINEYEKEIDEVNRIIFIPHGSGWETSFSALKHPRSKEYLFRTHEFLVSPSLRYCRITDNRPRIKNGEYLG